MTTDKTDAEKSGVRGREPKGTSVGVEKGAPGRADFDRVEEWAGRG